MTRVYKDRFLKNFFSNFRNSISTESLILSPGATVILTDQTPATSTIIIDTSQTTESTRTSSGTRWYIAIEVQLICIVCLNILFNL